MQTRVGQASRATKLMVPEVCVCDNEGKTLQIFFAYLSPLRSLALSDRRSAGAAGFSRTGGFIRGRDAVADASLACIQR